MVLAPESNGPDIQEGAAHHITPCRLPSAAGRREGKFLRTEFHPERLLLRHPGQAALEAPRQRGWLLLGPDLSDSN